MTDEEMQALASELLEVQTGFQLVLNRRRSVSPNAEPMQMLGAFVAAVELARAILLRIEHAQAREQLLGVAVERLCGVSTEAGCVGHA